MKQNKVMTLAALLLLGSAAASFADQPVDLEDTKAKLEKWVEARELISKEKQQWRAEKSVLKDRIDLVAGEIDSLQDKARQAKVDINDADKKREKLVIENEGLKTAAASLKEEIVALELKANQMLAVLPDPIVSRVKPLSQRIPADPQHTDLSLSERYQNVIGILNEVNKFAREITVTSEVRTMADGTSAEVQTLYVGIGQAYYCNLKGTVAGYGRPGAEGWQWVEDDALAPQVAEAISVFNNEVAAAYVPVPVEIEKN